MISNTSFINYGRKGTNNLSFRQLFSAKTQHCPRNECERKTQKVKQYNSTHPEREYSHFTFVT